MNINTLEAISPLDGRYCGKCEPLRGVFSEYGLVKRRVMVECAWLDALCAEKKIKECPPLKPAERKLLAAVGAEFSLADAARVKKIEATTNHDVKAVEYFIKGVLKARGLASRAEFVHFACTSEDINNMAHALMLNDGRALLGAEMLKFQGELRRLAASLSRVPMLAHTHGQCATPTTVGKELAVAASRLEREYARFSSIAMTAKMNGATGNYNAHLAAYPDVDWPAFSARVIKSFGLVQNPLTTQIEPHDAIAELFDSLCRWNTVLVDFCRDMWMYISMGYFRQRTVAGEVGSSTMPHKVNPIDFENAEGNLGLANAVLGYMARKLPISRMQRDLTDSTTLRNIGVGFGYTMVAVKSALKGLGRVAVDRERLDADLEFNWEVLAEPIQTVMRKVGMDRPYERLKELTRGRRVTREIMREFIENLPLPAADKRRLVALTPQTYTGNAGKGSYGK